MREDVTAAARQCFENGIRSLDDMSPRIYNFCFWTFLFTGIIFSHVYGSISWAMTKSSKKYPCSLGLFSCIAL